MHLSTEEPAVSRMLGPFGEVGGDVPEYFSSRTNFAKIEGKKLLRKTSSKNLTAEVSEAQQQNKSASNDDLK